MAEIQKTTNTGENAARFIEFVMMQAQNASLFLGLIPHPQSGQPETNLDLARMFIDQLVMIQEKTRGNLSTDETNVLRNALSNLQMAYVEVARGGGEAAAPDYPPEPMDEPASAMEMDAPATPVAPAPGAADASAPAAGDDSRENKKRFTKSYGS